MSYSLDYDQEVHLFVYKDSKVLEEISVENLVEPSDLPEQKVSDAIPEEISMYEQPSELSNDFFDYTVEYAGDMYKLPAPVSEFEKNGWKIKDEYKDMAVKGDSYGSFIELRKGNKNSSCTNI